MTAQTLLNRARAEIDALLKILDAETKAGHLAMRKAVLAATRDLWDLAAVAPSKNAAIGNMIYVSKAEAFKYGRMDSYKKLIQAQAKLLAARDALAFETNGSRIYTETRVGQSWAYSQGFGIVELPASKADEVARALYSNFYGAPFDETIKKNLGADAQNIIDTVVRALNQGKSYAQIAGELRVLSDQSYNKALRVARTEGGRVLSQAAYDFELLLDNAEIEYDKLWDAAIDTSTRPDHIEMDGELADKDGIFHLPDGSTGPEPRLTGVAKQDIQCRCNSVNCINGQKPKERRVRGEGLVPYETYKERLTKGKEIPISAVRAARK